MSDLFSGFPQAGLDFLADLEIHNEKPWFEANKAIYTTAIIEPAILFIEAIGQRLQTIVPTVQYDTRKNGAGSLMRIYRDVRFSKDKTPYKTWVGITFWDGLRKKNENPGFHFGFTAYSGGVHAGMHSFPPDLLAPFRTAVLDDAFGSELDSMTAELRANQYTVHGQHTKNVPRGFDKEHPRANWLRYNALYASAPESTSAELTSPALVDICFEHMRKMSALEQWLVKLTTSANTL